MEPFYKQGLKFECQQCGVCCTGEPGYVYVQEKDCRAMAEHLGISVPEFYLRFVRRVPGGYSLLERPDGSCIFFDQGCTVYPLRPVQCRTYPFWPEVMRSEKSWREEAKRCAGIGHGRHYDLVTIEELLRGRGETSAKP